MVVTVVAIGSAAAPAEDRMSTAQWLFGVPAITVVDDNASFVLILLPATVTVEDVDCMLEHSSLLNETNFASVLPPLWRPPPLL